MALRTALTCLAIHLVSCDGSGGPTDGATPDSDAAAGDDSGQTQDSGLDGVDAGPSGLGRVIFMDDFESGALDLWDGIGGEAGKYSITTDPALVRSGSGALDMTIRTDWADGQLNKWFDAVDELHVSMDIMFAAGWDQAGVTSRHLLQLSGNHVNVMRWGPYPDSSFGQAGVTPDGTDFFWIHLSPWNDDEWHLGMAHPEQSSQWGDSIISDAYTTPGQYQHVVLHGRLNDVGAQNGFVRLLVDGAVVIERTEVEWRATTDLVFNSTGFQAYYQGFSGTSHVYVDNFVVREGAPANP